MLQWRFFFLVWVGCSSSTLVCCSGVKQEINQHRTPLLTFLSLNQNTNTEKLNLHVTWHRTAITYSSRYTFGQKCSSVVKTLEKQCGELQTQQWNPRLAIPFCFTSKWSQVFGLFDWWSVHVPQVEQFGGLVRELWTKAAETSVLRWVDTWVLECDDSTTRRCRVFKIGTIGASSRRLSVGTVSLLWT